jgi:hypothetical protein
MRLLNRILSVILLTVLLGGCASPGAFLEESAMLQVQPGMTRAEVIRIMGQPKTSETGPDQTRMDEYVLMLDQPSSPTSGNLSYRKFQVLYKADGKVWYKESFSSLIPYWQQHNGIAIGGIRGGLKAIPKIEPGVTHVTELTAKIGEPMLIDMGLEGERLYHWFVIEGVRNSNVLKITGRLVVMLDAGNRIADYRIMQR